MKYLTLGLLLLNLFVFAWLQTQPEPFGDTARVSPLSGKQLVLLAEQPDTPALEPANERVAPRVTFVGVACYSLGPFVSEAGAREANETLAGLGLATQQREGTRRELTGYWVYIPPLLSRDEAREVTAMLKARGIKDFQIVSTGPKKNAISLGFFRSHDSAEQHYARISALGLNPVKEENYRENSGLWLDFSSPNRPPLPEAIVDALQQQYGGIAMHERNCS
ncbi:SPOR domain-containing protein [Sulfuriflexus mobilis]|uniref:SPOR domain-containing protein n=1 Tax=Sulfuriflexus mobilis TaxID=1811807 RepID=UPI000F81A3C9|nr:SPOR domain-containing protein [Sulfuriflexus mobilis]